MELDRLVEGCNTTSTAVTFRTQAGIAVGGTDANYRLHYGQATATNPPANPNNVYAVYDDFQDGDAAGWTTKGTWGVVNESGNYFYRYTGGGANWALAYLPMTDLANLDYVAKIRAATNTTWIGAAFRIHDQNNFLTFYQSRDTSQFKYARIVNDNHTVPANPAFPMPDTTWHRLRLQAIGNQVRARSGRTALLNLQRGRSRRPMPPIRPRPTSARRCTTTPPTRIGMIFRCADWRTPSQRSTFFWMWLRGGIQPGVIGRESPSPIRRHPSCCA